MLSSQKGFTLIELLVVIAIIAILAVVVVLTLNPAELLRQSRDANRISDMATLQSSIGLYQTDMGGAGTMGTSTFVYLSLPDTTNTCANLGLPALLPGSSYACSSSTSSRLANSQGWVPLNFSLISSGSPLSSLPIDPTNTSSSGLYYTYTTNGNQYQMLAIMESQKYKKSITGPLGNGIDVVGNNVGSAPGGWWGMDEGTASTTVDLSGNGNNGTWNGTAAGTNGTYYAQGKVGPWAGYFNGGNDYININNSPSLNFTSAVTMCAWIYPTVTPATSTYEGIFAKRLGSNYAYGINYNATTFQIYTSGSSGIQPFTYTPPVNVWTHICGVISSSPTALYTNGILFGILGSGGGLSINTFNLTIGASYAGYEPFTGLIDDVRVYNRALSAVEIQSMYSAEK
jgi:prepilin-type N-terminal cleavage/methylation domain-containing protein